MRRLSAEQAELAAAIARALRGLPPDEAARRAEQRTSDRLVIEAVVELVRGDGTDSRAETSASPVSTRSETADRVAVPAGREDETTGSPPSLGPAHADAWVGRTFGAYTITGVIGAGGMGLVLRAVQASPRREVALKLIRDPQRSESFARRFRREVEFLGRLRHPGIAQIYDAGVHDGTPYFAMELVAGETLSAYVKRARPTLERRLALFAQICDAVQDAHANGVIHRDLKPGNILVVDRPNAEPAAKVLDFGVARATDLDVQAVTVQTDVGQLVGTIPYMSPEQASGDPERLDTRSDVYALGVVLYELLAGRLPHDVRGRTPVDAVRMIQLDDPTRLSSIDQRLRGDVETIVGKALEKDKARRYQSASELAADVRRYLRSEPIAARPASTWYQLRKFSRRNRALVGGVAATMIALAAGLAGTAVALREAIAARDEARLRLDERDRVAAFQEGVIRDIETARLGRGILDELVHRAGLLPDADEASLGTLRGLAGAINPSDLAEAVLTDHVVRVSERRIESAFADDPGIATTLRASVAETYFELNAFDDAHAAYERAAEDAARLHGADDPRTLALRHGLGAVEFAWGQFADAAATLRTVHADRTATLGPRHPETAATADLLGRVLVETGEVGEGQRLLADALAVRTAAFGAESDEALATTIALTILDLDRGDAASALRRCEAFPRRLATPPTMDDALGMSLRHNLAGAYEVLADAAHERGDEAESLRLLASAEATHRALLDAELAALPSDHAAVVSTLNNLGNVIAFQGRAEEAEEVLRRARFAVRRGPAAGTVLAQSVMTNLGLLLLDDLERPGDAVGELESAFTLAEALYGPDDQRTQEAMSLLEAARAAAAEAQTR